MGICTLPWCTQVSIETGRPWHEGLDTHSYYTYKWRQRTDGCFPLGAVDLTRFVLGFRKKRQETASQEYPFLPHQGQLFMVLAQNWKSQRLLGIYLMKIKTTHHHVRSSRHGVCQVQVTWKASHAFIPTPHLQRGMPDPRLLQNKSTKNFFDHSPTLNVNVLVWSLYQHKWIKNTVDGKGRLATFQRYPLFVYKTHTLCSAVLRILRTEVCGHQSDDRVLSSIPNTNWWVGVGNGFQGTETESRQELQKKIG